MSTLAPVHAVPLKLGGHALIASQQRRKPAREHRMVLAPGGAQRSIEGQNQVITDQADVDVAVNLLLGLAQGVHDLEPRSEQLIGLLRLLYYLLVTNKIY